MCDICAAPGHIARVCPLRGKCFQCQREGHLSRDCPERAELRVRDEDPTPAEAAASASASPRQESDVDLRDNQLDELSQSILPPVLARVPAVSLDDLSVDSIESVPGVDIERGARAQNSAADIVVDNRTTENVASENVATVATENVVTENVVNVNVVDHTVVDNNVVDKDEVNVVVINDGNSEVNSNEIVNQITTNYTGNSEPNSSEPNYFPVDSGNIVDPGCSSLGASSQSGANLVEPGSSALFSSEASDSVVEGVSESLKRSHTEVSSDGDSLVGEPTKSRFSVRKPKGFRKPPSTTAAGPSRVTRASLGIPGLSRGLKAAAAEWSRLSKR